MVFCTFAHPRRDSPGCYIEASQRFGEKQSKQGDASSGEERKMVSLRQAKPGGEGTWCQLCFLHMVSGTDLKHLHYPIRSGLSATRPQPARSSESAATRTTLGTSTGEQSR